MTQQEVADAMNVARTALSKYERGDLDLNTEAIVQLCRIFNVTADYLLGLSSRRTAGVTEADAQMLHAYHAAPEPIRRIVDTALADYAEKKEPAAG